MPRRQPSEDSALTASLRTTITTALDNVRRQLQEAGATARGTAPSIHESCDVELRRSAKLGQLYSSEPGQPGGAIARRTPRTR